MTFPQYFVLEKLLEEHKINKDLSNYFIISVQHLLRSTGSLFEAIIRLGIKPQHIFLTGKIYSAHWATISRLSKIGINVKQPTIPGRLGYCANVLEKDVKDLWRDLENVIPKNGKIIILDDGGIALKTVPINLFKNHKVYGIEQTTSGLRFQHQFKAFPIIEVASSAAKVLIEPPIVSEAVRLKLGKEIRKLRPKTIGIVGYGHIGKAIAKEFGFKYSIIIYDDDERKTKLNELNFEVAQNINYLYHKSDVIIGATGNDISKRWWLTNSTSDKTLISVSSGDIEFNTLIRIAHKFLTDTFISPLQDLKLRTPRGYFLTILRGGCVANFTGEPDSSPGRIIQMTRGLLLSGIIQILQEKSALQIQNGSCVLSPTLQKEVVNWWFLDQPQRKSDYSQDIIRELQNTRSKIYKDPSLFS